MKVSQCRGAESDCGLALLDGKVSFACLELGNGQRKKLDSCHHLEEWVSFACFEAGPEEEEEEETGIWEFWSGWVSSAVWILIIWKGGIVSSAPEKPKRG